MNTPPLPHPSPYTCRNCGQQLQQWQEYCPHCGARMRHQSNSAGLILGSIALGCLALVFGSFGACFILIGIISIAESSTSIGFLGMGIVGAILAIASVIGAFLLLRRR